MKDSATGLRLEGAKRAVAWGAEASHWIVSALQDGELSIWLLPADSRGMKIKAYAGIDDKRLADLRFDGVQLPASACIAQGAAAQALLADAQAVALAAACAEAAGAMGALTLTLDYVKTRKQFGKAIGSFQAVQHRLADMLVKVELAKSLAAVALQVAPEGAASLPLLQSGQGAGQPVCPLSGRAGGAVARRYRFNQ